MTDALNSYDLLFRGATLVDGQGGTPYVADLAVRGDRIMAIGELDDATAEREIDARGLCLAPGFIDVHTHDDNRAIAAPEMLEKISQGVTTVIVGNCGISASPIVLEADPPDPMNLLGRREAFRYPRFSDYAEAVEQARPSLNLAALIGHTTLRAGVMDAFDRPATEAEIEVMAERLREALREGAIGLSTGLAYTNARQAPSSEVKALVKVVGEEGGIYTTHMRDEGAGLLDSIEESLATAGAGNAALVISHLKCMGAANWGRSAEALKRLEEGASAQPCNCDCYPYAASSTTLDTWRVTDEFEIMVTWSDPHPEMAKRTLADIATQWGVSLLEAAERLRPAGAIYHSMEEADVRRVLAHPLSMVGSDGLPSDPNPHPRLWGTFPRVLAHYCRELELFPLSEAIRKMTGLSAGRFQLEGRGVLREGAYADLVLFDFERVEDVATFTDPRRQSPGIELVVVNGQVGFEQGRSVGRSGRLLRRATG
ncbi:N-acyl-D-amino-acid deacylase family protein [Halotalea alkalilenta]|uniref:D-aminoacylase n=1 Tax=Halotalea alkalilenta TaxID=376489 RepID=A0A172YD29_9GAMM|nr:D-aminoacylase [Halotalea alkalilenta]ANF57123.1 D-aminoacylase [Halotalea alkalilenta]